MKCPYCEAESNVVDSRATQDGVRRRRFCPTCTRRFTTYERLGAPSIRVIKKGTRTAEAFESDKIIQALDRVCKDRSNIDAADIKRVALDIEAELVDARARSVTSGQVAAMVLRRLRDIDRISYDRLAINYIGEDGQLRTEGADPTVDPNQLALFAGGSEDE